MRTGILLSVFVMLLSFRSNGQTHSLTVKVTNIEAAKGRIHIGLFNKEEGFLKKGMAYKNALVDATGSSITYTFTGLPSGYYSVTMYHDENSDGHCNRNFLGIPKEAYGFSNNVRPKFSAPSFEDTKVMVKSNMEVTVKLIN